MGWTLSQPKPPTSSKPDENDRQVPRARVDSALAGLDWRKGARSDVSAQSGAAARAGEGARAGATGGGAGGEAGGGAVRARARDGLSELAEAQGVCGAACDGAAVSDGPGLLRGAGSGNRLGDGRQLRGRATRPRKAARVLELAGAAPARRGDEERGGTADAVRARLQSGRGQRSRAPRRAPRPVSRSGPSARDEWQRPARDGRRSRDRRAAARAGRRPEPRQRLRLDEAAPGRLWERLRARQRDARRRCAHGTVRPWRRWDAARRGAVLGPSRGRGAARPHPATCASPPGWATSS